MRPGRMKEMYEVAERGRIYLLVKCGELEAKVKSLEIHTHEQAHEIERLKAKIQETSAEKEYWQKNFAR